MLYVIAVFAPIVGSLVSGLLGRAIGDRASQAVSIICMLVAAGCGATAWVQFVWGGQPAVEVSIGTFLEAGSFHADWALRYDALAVTMVAMVTFVSMLIHVYSIGYMEHDAYPVYRFFSYLSLFTFAMLMLVTADNLLQLFFGWEGVGLASYLLIGYWYDRPSACAAAIKAMLVNRIGDLFFAVGIGMIFFIFGSISFSDIFQAIPQHLDAKYHLFGTDLSAYEVIGILILIGAMGKSAEIGLHTWLPDAMEGPTPVSALIHAATMVTAGVFLVARMSPLLEYAPVTKDAIVIVGATTAFFAATVACTQTDIKRVIAYSTCSQLGYMFIAAGVGAYQVSIFHLITHAFFKALLFLGAGSVIHAMGGEQDMRKMGGLWRRIPLTYVVMWAGSLAIAGIPLFAGYYSKDAILDSSFEAQSGVGMYAFACGIIAALLTAFYSWRLIFLTFHGRSRAEPHVLEHAHESPPVMAGPLVLLALGACFAGWGFDRLFIGEHWQDYWRDAIVNAPGNQILAAVEHTPLSIGLFPTITGVAGIALAYLMYMAFPSWPARLASTFRPVYLFLLNKWYFDELYDAIFVRPTFALARLLWHVGDETIIDGVPNGLAALTTESSSEVVKLQTGSIAVYAFSMLIGVVVLLGVFMLFR
jgi:NADH-quinone oxidoreductase subunit L